MNIREKLEAREERILSKYAQHSSKSRGRKFLEEECNIRTSYQRDRDRIIHSKAFRRLKHKTQVFIAPEGDHYRTRLTHTLEVSQIARTISRALRLNEDLTEAIALGHDLGHTPFGHTGEEVLNNLSPYGFKHNKQSVRILDVLEKRKNNLSLNLTYEVKEGILHHSGSRKSSTLEGRVVSLADRIAYINHDIDDALRANIIRINDIPKDCLKVLGYSHGERIDTMIKDIVCNSKNKNDIILSDKINRKMNKLRNFMFEKVYINSKAKSEEKKAEYIIKELFYYYNKNIDRLPKEYLNNDTPIEVSICDYIAGMTDRYAINLFANLFLPKGWNE